MPGRLPHIAGLDYCGDCHPAGEVCGDFFDFRRLPGNELAVSIGDVSGREIGAALLMSGIQAFLRGLTSRGSGEILGVVEELNRVVCQVAPDNLYSTLFYAHVDPRRREVRYVNAGHEPPLLWRKRTGRPQRLDSTGTVLGLTRESEQSDLFTAFRRSFAALKCYRPMPYFYNCSEGASAQWA